MIVRKGFARRVGTSAAAVAFCPVFFALGDAEGTGGGVVGCGDVVKKDGHCAV